MDVDAGQQFRRLKRLRDEIGRSQTKPEHPIFDLPGGTEKDDRNRAGLLIGFKPAADLESVHSPHADIQQDQSGCGGAHRGQCELAAIGGTHPVAAARQRIRQQAK